MADKRKSAPSDKSQPSPKAAKPVTEEPAITDAPEEPEMVSAVSLDSAPSRSEALATEPSQPNNKPAAILPGHLIAERYEVLSVLGEGGMGIVYGCRDRATQEEVAVKRVIPPDSELAAEYIAWFYKEARALASLDHPSIVRARDFGRLRDNSPYLAMDQVSGVSLHDLAQTRLSFPAIWVVVDQILGALGHAHARGVIHGDLKPSNVLVEEIEDEPPLVHILDFGLAWLKLDPHDERLDGEKSMEFAPHAGAGTPGYMAPEQIQHEMHHVCGATDMYSLGCILFKMLSGRSPFHGDSKELLRLHAFEAPPELKLNVDAPDDVVGFVRRLLAKRPWDRFEFAAEARALWNKWRPAPDTSGSAWKFPRLPSSPKNTSEKTRRTGPRGTSRELQPAPERAPGLLSIRPSPMVGRDDIRQKLREVTDDVVESSGPPHRLVILVGPAGSGKSRIAEWLCEVVHEEGSMIPLRARYRPMRGPLDGMLGAVTQYFSFERTERPVVEKSLMARWNAKKADKNARSWVAGASEWLRPYPPGEDHPIGPSGVKFSLDTLEMRRLVIRYTLRRIARGRPLLYWLDDLHNASEATFQGLARIHEEEPDQRIVMVATVRSEDVQIGGQAAERIRLLREALNGDVVEVPSMDPDTVRALMRASLPLDDEAVEEAARRSRGNPLFALQQLHAWALAGDLEFRSGQYRVPEEVLAVRPKTTAELWRHRVETIPEQHRIAAYAVSALGADIRRDVLDALLEAVGVDPDAGAAALQHAEVILPGGQRRFAWPHQLLQEYLLAELQKRPDASEIFRAAAEALTKHALANNRRIIRQRVTNLLRAKDAVAAGELLFDFLAMTWIGSREPLASLADLELLKGALEGRSLALKHRWQAEALRHVGRPDEAITHAEIARTSFEELGDREQLAHCLRLLGHLSSEKGQSVEGLALCLKALEIFVELEHLAGRAQCEAVIAEIEYLLGNYENTRAYSQSGQTNFAALRQPLGRGQCLLLESWGRSQRRSD